MAVGAQSAGSQGALVTREKTKLRKVLRRFDLILFTACAMVGLDSVAFAAQSGAQAITWLVISLVLFLIPYGMLVAELGSAFPVEGGPYEWVKMSFGRLVGSVTAVMYWLTNPIWIGGTLAATAIATLNDFVVRKPLGTAPRSSSALPSPGSAWRSPSSPSATGSGRPTSAPS